MTREQGAIAAPESDAPALLAKVNALRAAGEVVINSLSSGMDSRCDRQLVEKGGEWQVEKTGTDPIS
jgi:ATP phosphoribosyltransferase regulatory subunit